MIGRDSVNVEDGRISQLRRCNRGQVIEANTVSRNRTLNTYVPFTAKRRGRGLV
jgi:hypothetical protein